MQRKVFRVEQMFGERRTAAVPRQPAGREAINQRQMPRGLSERRDAAAEDLRSELATVQDVIARNREELAALIGESPSRRMTRAAGELGAAVDGMEKATHRILAAAEGIDDSAKSLGSALRTEFERGLAQDIQDHAVQIYEACNFHDLAGQRIGKVIATLHMVEEQLSGMLARYSALGGPREPAAAAPAESNGLLNGPKLDGDSGHASQGDIDALFG